MGVFKRKNRVMDMWWCVTVLVTYKTHGEGVFHAAQVLATSRQTSTLDSSVGTIVDVFLSLE